jgi:NADP-dependent 3-hydroxy acid dehydrogenase YdfG
MNKIVFITGATAGIGEAIAVKFAQHHYRLILTGRREDRLVALARDLVNRFGVEVLTLVFDVRDREAVNKAVDTLPAEWKEIDVLINNAGLAAGFDQIQNGSIEDWEVMIDTNVKGLLYCTKAILPSMINKKQGHIINLGSTASKYVYEKGNVYCASKAAVDSLSQAMRIDLLKDNIRVTAIHPGAVRTEFASVRMKGDAEKVEAVYKGFTPLTAEDIADVIYYCVSVPPHVCINELIIAPTAQANPFYVDRR